MYSENANTTVVGDVGLFDNDSDAEEPQIIPLDELQADSESESDDEPSSENYNEGRFLSRSRQKRRYCLEGCDCERPRGRLCECEKKGDGMCSDLCQCDPEKCRSSPAAASDEDDEDEDEDD